MKNLEGLSIFTIHTHEKISQQSWRKPSNASINNVSMANAAMVSKISATLSVKNFRSPDKSNLLFGLKKENHPSLDKENLQLQAQATYGRSSSHKLSILSQTTHKFWLQFGPGLNSVAGVLS